jgi:hypothetical protein
MRKHTDLSSAINPKEKESPHLRLRLHQGARLLGRLRGASSCLGTVEYDPQAQRGVGNYRLVG